MPWGWGRVLLQNSNSFFGHCVFQKFFIIRKIYIIYNIILYSIYAVAIGATDRQAYFFSFLFFFYITYFNNAPWSPQAKCLYFIVIKMSASGAPIRSGDRFKSGSVSFLFNIFSPEIPQKHLIH